ncbi:MAG: hypothetical protein WA875_15275, partial [Candidatus Acidiferrales bacterium]
VIRDELLFPYLAGAGFAQQFLKAHQGWQDIHLLFENPPASSQQILHPQLYLKGVQPQKVASLDWNSIAPADWKLLDENILGEFGLGEVLKQFVGEQQAARISPMWAGDRYAVFEDAKTKQTPLVFHLALQSPEDAALFFGQYSSLLELKYKIRKELFRRPNYFQFQADDGAVFLRCVESECVTVEGAPREVFDKINRALGWSPAPGPDAAASAVPRETASLSWLPRSEPFSAIAGAAIQAR